MASSDPEKKDGSLIGIAQAFSNSEHQEPDVGLFLHLKERLASASPEEKRALLNEYMIGPDDTTEGTDVTISMAETDVHAEAKTPISVPERVRLRLERMAGRKKIDPEPVASTRIEPEEAKPAEEISRPKLEYLGPDELEPEVAKPAVEPEVAREELPKGPAKVEEIVSIGPDGGVLSEQGRNVSGGIEKFDQDLPPKSDVVNKDLARRDLNKRGLDHSKNLEIAVKAIKNSLPQAPKVSAIELRDEDEPVSGARNLDPEQQAKDAASGADDSAAVVVEELDGLMDQPLAEAPAAKPLDPTLKPKKELDAETLDGGKEIRILRGEKPAASGRIKASAPEFVNPAREKALKLINEANNTGGNITIDNVEEEPLPRTEAPVIETQPVLPNQTEAEGHEQVESGDIQAKKDEVKLVEVPQDHIVASVEAEPGPLPTLEKEPHAKIIEPTEDKKKEGVIGEIQPVDISSQSSREIPIGTQKQASGPKLPLSARFRNWAAGLARSSEVSSKQVHDIEEMAADARREASEEEQLRKAA